jgi:hypothetical protein
MDSNLIYQMVNDFFLLHELLFVFILSNIISLMIFLENRTAVKDQPELFLIDLIDLSTMISPNMAKNWHTLGNWSYRCGKKYADKIQLSSTQTNNGVESELFLLNELLPAHISNDEREFIASVFSQSLSSLKLPTLTSNASKDYIKSYLSECISKRLKTNAQNECDYSNINGELRSVLLENCTTLEQESIDSIIEAWENIVTRVYNYYKVACNSYFKFLKLSANVSKRFYINII